MIRPATRADLPKLCEMVHALAAYHGDGAQATEATLARDLVGAAPWLHALVYEESGRLHGYAALTQLARLQYGQRGMDLHHLFVHADYRGDGIGKALLAGVEQLARELDCCKLTLEVLEGNKVAQAAYKASGFEGYELNPQVGRALFWQKKL